MSRYEPGNRRWLVAALVIGTIALLVGMVMIIAIKAGIVTLN